MPMKTVTATELARNLREILDRLVREGEEVVIERNHREVARLVPLPAHRTALEAMEDLYNTLSPDAARGWVEEARAALPDTLDQEPSDPWAS